MLRTSHAEMTVVTAEMKEVFIGSPCRCSRRGVAVAEGEASRGPVVEVCVWVSTSGSVNSTPGDMAIIYRCLVIGEDMVIIYRCLVIGEDKVIVGNREDHALVAVKVRLCQTHPPQ